jgi:hypothetical protein
MTMQTDAQDTLDRLKAAQQKPLGDPRFKSLIGLEKSTFSQNASATSGLTFYDLALLWQINGLVTLGSEALRSDGSASDGRLECGSDGLAEAVR